MFEQALVGELRIKGFHRGRWVRAILSASVSLNVQSLEWD